VTQRYGVPPSAVQREIAVGFNVFIVSVFQGSPGKPSTS